MFDDGGDLSRASLSLAPNKNSLKYMNGNGPIR